MKWLRIILPIFLLVGILACPTVTLANDPDGLDVVVTVKGDDADVDVNVIGDNSDVTVNTTGTEVWINGHNLDEPTAVYNVQNYSIGVDGGWVKRKISESLAPFQLWAEEQTIGLNLTAEGLAKVIILAQGNESILGTLVSLSDEHGDRLTDLESETAHLGEQVDDLGERVDALDAQITANNRTLVIIIGVFSLVVIGLIIGLVVVARRTRIQ